MVTLYTSTAKILKCQMSLAKNTFAKILMVMTDESLSSSHWQGSPYNKLHLPFTIFVIAYIFLQSIFCFIPFWIGV